VSSAQQAAKTLRNLEQEDWVVLEALEKAMSRFESVPLRPLIRETGYYPEQLKFRLSRLNYLGFVMNTQYGYVMNAGGLDLLALHAFVEEGLITGMGSAVGMGKESDVFEVISESGEESVIKFYRIGRTSFRSTRKTRTYVNPSNQHQWLSINVGAAQKEAEGLTRAKDAGVNVPRFFARNRHAVLMSKIDGVMLFRCKKQDIENPAHLFAEILENIRRAFVRGKMVNGDISEFNILYDGELPWIIDWPQYVSVSHPNASELLRHDVSEPARFFGKKFGVKLNLERAISYVEGKSKKLTKIQI
jgi:RIO kinase 2